MTIDSCSLFNYRAKVKPNLSYGQRQVLNSLYLQNRTSEQIAAFLETQVHKISGRITELQKSGLIESKNKAVNSDGNLVNIWGLKK